jgi:hypothetical protein
VVLFGEGAAVAFAAVFHESSMSGVESFVSEFVSTLKTKYLFHPEGKDELHVALHTERDGAVVVDGLLSSRWFYCYRIGDGTCQAAISTRTEEDVV